MAIPSSQRCAAVLKGDEAEQQLTSDNLMPRLLVLMMHDKYATIMHRSGVQKQQLAHRGSQPCLDFDLKI